MRRVFGPKSDEVTGKWNKQHNEELNDLYFLPRYSGYQSRRMRWSEHVGRMGRGEVYTQGNLRETDHL